MGNTPVLKDWPGETISRRDHNWESLEAPSIVLGVREAQVRQLYKQTWGGLLGTLIVAVLASAALWSAVPPKRLAVWLVVLLLLILARSVLVVTFQRKRPAGPQLLHWAHVHTAGTIASAAMWGAPAIFLWPSEGTIEQIVWPICIVSISASAVGMYCTWKPSYVPFLVLSLLPVSIRMMVAGDGIHITLGLLGIVFTVILTGTGNVMHESNRRTFLTSQRNEALSWTLAAEKARVEKLNQRLRAEMREREKSRTELELAQDNIKQLSGMLPICSSCKMIRNDEGYWEQIDAYLSDRSEVDFSHGICPDCTRKIYAPYLGDRKSETS